MRAPGVVWWSWEYFFILWRMSFLPAVTVNLILGFNPVVVTFLGIWLLAEVPNRIQWLGVVAAMGGVVAYFYPVQFPRGEVLGLSAGVICMLATAYSSILGRAENRRGVLSPLAVTVISMGVGAPLMLVSGLVSETWVPISLESWAIILYLAVVNTALAFTWWNLTLRTLPAMESSMVNNAMTIQVPVIAFLFLNETMGMRQIMGLALIAVGVMAVQIGKMPRMQHQTQQQP
jgi:drug/metabolite transporter (DMT)-like permease